MSKAIRRAVWVAGVLAGVSAVAALTLFLFLTRYDFNSLKPGIERAALEATGRELVLMGDMDLKIGLRPCLVVRDARVANAPWGSTPYMITIERFEIQAALIPLLTGEVRINRLMAVRPDILVETGPDGKTNLTMEPPDQVKDSAPALAEAEGLRIPPLTVYDLRIADGSLTYRDGSDGGSYRFSIPELKARSASGISPIDLEMEGSAAGMDFRLSGSLGSIRSITDPQMPWPVDVSIEGFGCSLGIRGDILDPPSFSGASLTLDGSVNVPEKLNQALGQQLPLGADPFTLRTSFSSASKRIYTFEDLKITNGQSDLTGSSTLDLSGTRPSVSLDLRSDTLDLDRIFRNYGPANTAPSPERPRETVHRGDRVFPDDPLSLEWLDNLDAAVSFQARELTLPRTVLTDARIAAKLESGRLIVHSFQAAAGDGLIRGAFHLETVPPEVKTALSVRTENLDLAGLTARLRGGDRFSGRLNAEAELMGQGGSIAAVMAGLDGWVKLALSNGTVEDSYLDLVGSDLRSGILRLLNPLKDRSEPVEVNCLIAMVEVEEGLAEITVLVFDTPTMTVRGHGGMDLRTEALDVGLAPRPKEGLDTRVAGRFSLSLGELTRSFKLGGTLSRPTLALDPTQTVTTIAKGLGGMMLLGPVGIAGALASGTEQDADPCLSAMRLLDGTKGSPYSERASDAEADSRPGAVEKGGKVVRDAARGVQDAFKRLFGN